MGPPAQAAPITNRLLDRLPARDRAHLLDACEALELVLGQVLAQPGDAMRDVYFPTGACISLVAPMEANSHLEVAIIGDEGFYGMPIALGVAVSPVLALVETSGGAQRIGAAAFRRELARMPALRDCVDRYMHTLTSQLIRAVGCNRFHLVEQRVARWLLTSADRARSPRFHVTHESLAHRLGVRRVGITEAAGALQERNLIGYSRGMMKIRDRHGLERASCGCYRADVSAYERTFN